MSVIHHQALIIDHQNEKYFLGLAQMCINQDTNSMNRFLQFVLSQGY